MSGIPRIPVSREAFWSAVTPLLAVPVFAIAYALARGYGLAIVALAWVVANGFAIMLALEARKGFRENPGLRVGLRLPWIGIALAALNLAWPWPVVGWRLSREATMLTTAEQTRINQSEAADWIKAFHERTGAYPSGDDLKDAPLDDPFGVDGARLRYLADDRGWILVSPGPDGVCDVEPSRDFAPRAADAMRSLKALRYDPTNGAISGGDIVRIKW